MSNAHELSKEDCKEIIKFTIIIRKKWKVIKPIRNKILAHQEKLEEGRILEILKKGQYDRFEEIIQDLLTLENIFQGAFLNGTKPDYDFKNSWVKSEREEEVKRLFKLLQHGSVMEDSHPENIPEVLDHSRALRPAIPPLTEEKIQEAIDNGRL
jgi:hypothetical protein